jgi:hypothetical protein
VGEKLGQRALNIYSAVAVTYTVPKYSVAVGDALIPLPSTMYQYQAMFSLKFVDFMGLIWTSSNIYSWPLFIVKKELVNNGIETKKNAWIEYDIRINYANVC